MTHAQQKQLVRGALFLVFGAFFAGYAVLNLEIGTPRSMGAGMFPMIMGVIVALFGLGFVLPTLIELRSGRAPQGPDSRWERIDWRSVIAVAAALAAFTALVGYFGLIPATFAMTAVAALGNRRITPLLAVLLSTGFLVTSYVIFVLGLNLPLQFWEWPF